MSDVVRVYRWREPVDYAVAYNTQLALWERTLRAEAPDALLVLTHPPTFTVGKSGKLDNLLRDRVDLAREGLAVFFSDRGGDITYHGPGQIVAYPIIDLRRRGKDVHRYIHDLEEVIIRTLADFSVDAHRDDRHVGVWVGDEKIAAIGVRIRRWVTLHGLALNVNPIMEHFSYINPCGILDRGVTSMTGLLSRTVDTDEVVPSLVESFSTVFSAEIEWASAAAIGCER